MLQAVGIIAAVGESVTNLKVGTPAAIMTFGSYAEFTMVRCLKNTVLFFFQCLLRSAFIFNVRNVSKFTLIMILFYFLISFFCLFLLSITSVITDELCT